MKFSLHVQTRITDWQFIKELEDLGYDAAWVPDTQMMWSDCYATMALAAHHTSRIRIGTGVAIAGTRIAPTTAAAISSINAIAPGRIFLGIGTGHTAMRVMGQDPIPIKEFRDYLRVVRALLDGEEVDYTYRDKTTAIVWQNHGSGFRNIEDRIPIYVAANGPRALRAAGMYGDGLIAVFNEQKEILEFNLRHIHEGAAKAGRKLDDYHTVSLTNAVILRAGEKLTDAAVIERAGSWVVTALHFIFEIWRYTKDDSVVPEYMKGIWEEYVDHVSDFPLPKEKWHQVLHEGHCSYFTPGERKFVTPAMLEGTSIVGGPSEVAEKIRAAAKHGLGEVSLLPPLAHMREVAADFAKQVIPLCR
jgi:alkanesulfonate monooxygenase SsuD/methylene tetrahydromethanopterin reductase-like flavin-dependent oxidoreductase (luciferase family)